MAVFENYLNGIGISINFVVLDQRPKSNQTTMLGNKIGWMYTNIRDIQINSVDFFVVCMMKNNPY